MERWFLLCFRIAHTPYGNRYDASIRRMASCMRETDEVGNRRHSYEACGASKYLYWKKCDAHQRREEYTRGLL